MQIALRIMVLMLPFLQGCSLIAVALTPPEVVDSVARGESVARAALSNPPQTEEDLKAYFKTNAELWLELAKWYEIIQNETE